MELQYFKKLPNYGLRVAGKFLTSIVVKNKLCGKISTTDHDHAAVYLCMRGTHTVS